MLGRLLDLAYNADENWRCKGLKFFHSLLYEANFLARILNILIINSGFGIIYFSIVFTILMSITHIFNLKSLYIMKLLYSHIVFVVWKMFQCIEPRLVNIAIFQCFILPWRVDIFLVSTEIFSLLYLANAV